MSFPWLTVIGALPLVGAAVVLALPSRQAHRAREIALGASDLELPEGTTLLVDPDTLVVNITQAQTAEQLEAELAEAEADAGIVHEVSDEEAAAEAPSGEGEGDAAPAEGDSAE